MCLIYKSGLIAWIGERNNQLFSHLRCFIDSLKPGDRNNKPFSHFCLYPHQYLVSTHSHSAETKTFFNFLCSKH